MPLSGPRETQNRIFKNSGNALRKRKEVMSIPGLVPDHTIEFKAEEIIRKKRKSRKEDYQRSKGTFYEAFLLDKNRQMSFDINPIDTDSGVSEEVTPSNSSPEPCDIKQERLSPTMANEASEWQINGECSRTHMECLLKTIEANAELTKELKQDTDCLKRQTRKISDFVNGDLQKDLYLDALDGNEGKIVFELSVKMGVRLRIEPLKTLEKLTKFCKETF